MTKHVNKYVVVDCAFNRAWYADLIGKAFDYPPPYAATATIRVPA